MSNPETINNFAIQKVKLTSEGAHNSFLIHPVTLDGTVLGEKNMNVDGSITPVKFSVKPPAGTIYYLTRLIFYLQDSATMDSGGWGNNGSSPLTNGLLPYYTINGITTPALPFPIKSHGDLASTDFDITKHSWGSGDEFIVSRFTFTKMGSILKLDGDKGDEWFIEVKDDLTYLTKQTIILQGFTNKMQ